MEFLAERTQRARRDRKCFACGGLIPAGRRYVVAAFVNDGRAYSVGEHAYCKRVMQGWCDESWSRFEGYEEGSLAEIVRDYDVPLPPPDEGEEADYADVVAALGADREPA